MDTNTLCNALEELADELDKGDDADIFWLKSQGNIVRRAITTLRSSTRDYGPPATTGI
jgi:hypothetical protein